MKPVFFVFLSLILFLTLACGLLTPPSADQTGIATMVAGTVAAELAVKPSATDQLPENTPAILPETSIPTTAESTPVQSGIPYTFQNISLIIPNGIADSGSGEIVPEKNDTNSAPWDFAPEHIKITFAAYPISREGFGPEIHIYPAEQYLNLNPDGGNSLSLLRSILNNPGTPLSNNTLPGIPFFNAAKLYSAQAGLLKLPTGGGVRMISESAQYPAPVVKDISYYHFEGLTTDGKYFIIALFPIIIPLQATQDNPSADGIQFPGDMDDAVSSQKYYQAVTDLLNNASPDSFQPALSQIDALIQSIQINP